MTTNTPKTDYIKDRTELRERIVSTLVFVPLAILGLLVFLFCEKVKFYQVLSPRNIFLLDSLVIFVDALLISTIVAEFMSQKRLSFKKELEVVLDDKSEIDNKNNISLRVLNTFKLLIPTLATLPKVLISYFLLVFFTQASLSLFEASPVPLLFLLVFFVWAPYFVAYERFAKELTKQDKEDEVIDFFDEGSEVIPPKRMFSGMSWWKLGFSRSIEFTSRNLSLSVSLVLSIWLAKVLPELLSTLIGDPLSDFKAVIFSNVLGWFLGLYLHIFTVRTIFNKLEPEEKDELSLLLKTKSPKVDLSYTPPFGVRTSVLISLALCCSFLWWERQIQIGGLSKAAQFKVLEVQSNEKELVLTLEITDELRKLRWFSPSRLRLFESKPVVSEKENIPEKVEEASKPTNPLGTPQINSTADIMRLLSEELEPPARYSVTDLNNKTLSAYQISPRAEPIKIIVAFPIKKRAKEASAPLYELSYLSIVGFKEVLYTFSPNTN